jgi:rhodanese-related sulfurtransferase
LLNDMGIAISPRGDRPKHRIRKLSFTDAKTMSSFNAISIDKLSRLIGTPRCPVLIDVQTEDDFRADPRLVPGAVRRPFATVPDWGREFSGRSAVVICRKGLKLSHGVAAWLRHAGIPADSLEGGALAWAQAGLPMVPEAKLPPRDRRGGPCGSRARGPRSIGSPAPG